MLACLDECGLDSAAQRVRTQWRQFLEEAGIQAEPEYQRCVPDALLLRIAADAKAGVAGLGCRVVSADTADDVHRILNAAWDQFWLAPESYSEWEPTAMADLRRASPAKGLS